MKDNNKGLWKIEEDLGALFHRPSYHIAAFDGWRVLFNLSVISLHLGMRFQSLLPESGPLFDRWVYHPYSPLRDMSSMQVDVFLLMSGLLFSSHMISTFERNKNRSFLSFYPELVFNRFLRLAPALFVYLAVLWILSDPGIHNAWTHLVFMGNQLSEIATCDVDYVDTAVHLWSNSLEMQLFIVFSILFYVLYKYQKLNVKVLVLLFLSSFVINYLSFKPGEIGAITAKIDTGAHTFLTTGIFNEIYAKFPAGREWHKTNYGLVLPGNKVCADAPYWYHFMKYLYLPMYARFSSFIAGCIISLHMYNTSKKPALTSSSFLWKLLGWILYIISILFVMMIALRPSPKNPHPNVDLFGSVAVRQFFAAAIGFLIYCTIVPETHPFHATLLKKFMGLSFWYPLSVLSYGSYLFHFRIQFFVTYFLMPVAAEQVDFYYFGEALLVVLVLTFLAAVAEHVLVEAPVQRLRHKWFSTPAKTAKPALKTQ